MVNSDIFFPCKIPRIFDGSVQMYKKAYSMKNEHCNFVHFIFRHKLRSADNKGAKKYYQRPARWKNIEA